MAISNKKIISRQVKICALMAMACLASNFLAETTCRAEDSRASVTQALDLNCAQMLEGTLNKSLDKGSIIEMQRNLIQLGYTPEWVDGIPGPRTRSALRQFCERARFALATELRVMLQNHVEIARAYPHWTQTLESDEFAKWVEGEPDADEIGLSKSTGSSVEVIALLDRYQKRKVTNTATQPVAKPVTQTVTQTVTQPIDDIQVSYMLTGENFKQLKEMSKLFKLLEKLQDETFANKQEFEAAVEVALKGVAEPEKYIGMALKYAGPQTGRKLSEESFNKLKVEAVPAYIQQPLLQLKDVNFPPEKIEGSVKAALGGLADKVSQYDPGEIVALAKITESGTLIFSGPSSQKFSGAHKGDPAADAILAKLLKLQNVEYQSAKTMTAAMKKVLKQAADEIGGYQPAILAATVKTAAYGLTEASMLDMKGQTEKIALPEVYIEMLGDLQDVEYPSAELFWKATQAEITLAGTNNVTRVAIVNVLDEEVAKEIDGPLLDKLRAKGVPPALTPLLRGLRGDSTQNLEDKIDLMLTKLEKDYLQYEKMLVSMARKTHRFDETKVIQWSGESCGCVHDNLSGQVYGFYPYWMAGEKQVIDFSVQTRFGYYALGFDDKGNILDATNWSGLDRGFISEARTYGSKVDLVIRKGDWKKWDQSSAPEKNEAFEKLATDISKLLGIPLPGYTSSLIPYISLGRSKPPVMGDGVTLYFEGYPHDEESVGTFVAFIRNLAKKLQEQNRQYSINLMFPSKEIGVGIYGYDNLLNIMKILADEKLDGLFAVLLQEPTTDDKKLLRKNIEDGAHGEKRRMLLRNVVTVITYDGHDEHQLTDDVIYAKNNFDGIGFWEQPLMSASGVAGGVINKVLHDNFIDNGKGDIDAAKIDAASAREDVPGVCKYICPYKWKYRIAFGSFAFAMLASVFMLFLSCAWRVIFEDHFIHFIVGIVVPTFALGMALLYCDPALDELSKGNSPLIFVILAIIGYFIWNYHDKKNRADLP